MGEGGGARLARVIHVIDDIMLGARDVTQRVMTSRSGGHCDQHQSSLVIQSLSE